MPLRRVWLKIHQFLDIPGTNMVKNGGQKYRVLVKLEHIAIKLSLDGNVFADRSECYSLILSIRYSMYGKRRSATVCANQQHLFPEITQRSSRGWISALKQESMLSEVPNLRRSPRILRCNHQMPAQNDTGFYVLQDASRSAPVAPQLQKIFD